MTTRAKSSEVIRSAGRRSRHSSQGSSRLGASGSSNNTSVDLDSRYCYKVEDTPVTFSRNSSLSSLSVSSNEEEPSAEDQALLDSCISSAMPTKFKVDRSANAGFKVPQVFFFFFFFINNSMLLVSLENVLIHVVSFA